MFVAPVANVEDKRSGSYQGLDVRSVVMLVESHSRQSEPSNDMAPNMMLTRRQERSPCFDVFVYRAILCQFHDLDFISDTWPWRSGVRRGQACSQKVFGECMVLVIRGGIM